ncbi:MAG: integrase core domain-containing protein, partial [Candidatus Subteraquimicrobiales bacterium]|nr:integrase core domain-containing protein [Candidatus Subteraquimicrobiales bacterium]
MVKNKIEYILLDRQGISGNEIRKELTSQGIKIGKTKFYWLVKRFKLTVNSKKKAWRTKNYKMPASPNLIKGRTFRRVFEVLFADYTVIETKEGKLWLIMVEDLISRYVTSYRICGSCKSFPVVEALAESMALKKSLKLRYTTIFHTDRGSEFVNHAVENYAQNYEINLSNTGENHCYENAFMESLNKTLKHCYGLRTNFTTKEEANDEIGKAIKRYNNFHHHASLGKRIPYSVLMSYTGLRKGRKSENPEGKSCSNHPNGRVARIYSKSLSVKIKRI